MLAEIVLAAAFVAVIVATRWATRRWTHGSTSEPWVLLVSSALLTVMAWAWSNPATYGPSIVLTGAAAISSYRSIETIWAQRIQNKHTN